MNPNQTNSASQLGRIAKLGALVLAAALAMTLAVRAANAAPARDALSRPQMGGHAAVFMAIDPVGNQAAHNIGKYVDSHQVLWPELGQPKPAER